MAIDMSPFIDLSMIYPRKNHGFFGELPAVVSMGFLPNYIPSLSRK